MMKTKATGLKVTRSGVWVYYLDTGAAVSRPRAVMIPWYMLADAYEHLENGVERVFTSRLKAAEEQDWLPLEKWE